MGKLNRREAIRLCMGSVAGALLMSCPLIGLCRRTSSKIPIRGIYVPGWKGVNQQLIDGVIAFLIQNDLNTLMIDVKNAFGELFYSPESELAQRIDAQVRTKGGHLRALNMDCLLKAAEKNKIRLIARHVMFADKALYEGIPEFRLLKGKSKYWVDMRLSGVLDYNAELMSQEVRMGFDEIVLDYMRYPDVPGIASEKERSSIIDQVAKGLRKVVDGRSVELSIQVFGYSAWSHYYSNVGQRLETLQHHFDKIYPLLYPSHFFEGSLGFKKPVEHPFEIIRQGFQAARSKITTSCEILPMLQGFSYSAEAIRQQILAVEKYNMPGYVVWNSSGNHGRLAEALRGMKMNSTKR